MRPEARRGRRKMSEEKYKHENELDCEVTVYEGAHNTCDQTHDESQKMQATKKDTSSKEKRIKDNYHI